MVDQRCDWRAAGRHHGVVCQLRDGGTQHQVSLHDAKERSALAGLPAIVSTIASGRHANVACIAHAT
eukprot:11826124-Prorocentrum_lima.AAC.1